MASNNSGSCVDVIARGLAAKALKGGGGGGSWDDISSKPFETIGDGLTVDENDALKVNSTVIPTVSAMNEAIASAIGNAIGGSY